MSNTSARTKYADIIDMPHHVSVRHAAMPMSDRAAQFSPFAALTGYEAAVKETGRLTDERPELSEHDRNILDSKLQLLESLDKPCVSVTFFVPDRSKNGGSFETYTGRLEKTDKYKRQLILEGREAIAIDDIFGLECDGFKVLE